jgi:hypothetical protein
MKPILVPLCAAALLTAAATAHAQERGSALPPLPSPVESAGLTAAGSRAFLGAEGFFNSAGDAIGRGCADLFVGQGRFWKRTANSLFADFKEKPAGTPPRYDQM